MAKILVVLILLGILASLGSAMIFLVKDKGRSNRTLRALTFRIGLSVGLFGLLFLLNWMGVIEPHGLRP